PDDWAGRNLLLELGPIDDSDIIWFNGVRIASTIEASAEPRRYRVPAGIVKPGKTTITVMASDAGGPGGFSGPAELMKIGPIDRMATTRPSVSMAGEWEWRRGGVHVGGRPRPAPVNTGSPGSSSTDYAALYNGMIAPFTPFAVRGAIWYQGESNDGEPDRYRTFLPLLIEDWKRSFEREEFPFGIVQLAAYKAERDDLAAEGGWALLRD
ncbi:MAG: sialate O-acetylesterase, partial [Phycisphaeraceae bacterium]|nr:sialate O-acetylesterase [Phycisphaeraceae bacterium]